MCSASHACECVCVCVRACLRADFISYCFFQRLHRTISIPVRSPGLLRDVSSFEDDTSPQACASVGEREEEREGRERLGLSLEGRERRAEYAAFLHSPGFEVRR